MIKLLSPAKAAEKLNETGLCGRVTVKRLANFRSEGRGPPFRKVGKIRVFYDETELLAWVESQISPPLRSAAEFKAQKFIEVGKRQAAAREHAGAI
jgi:hypothetical protein